MVANRIEKHSVHDAVYWQLREAVQDGVFKPGDKLTNRQLAEMIGYSVTPVREAIRRLVSEGALRELPNGSVSATELRIEDFLDEISWLLVTLETRAASLAMPNLNAADVVRLESLFEQARAACERGDEVRANARFREFYFHIFAASNQPALVSLLDMLWLRAASLHRSVFPPFAKLENGRHYREMLDAARKRAPHAAVLAIAGYHSRLESYLRSLIETKTRGEHR
jgi:DNA-binding GntR family transcriptional regulator